MPTLTHLCGFEEGGYSDGPFLAGAHDYSDVGSATGLSWDTNIKRNGTYALKCSAGSGLDKFINNAHSVGTIWFRWSGINTTTQVLLLTTTEAGFRISTTGVLSASAGSTYVNGPTLAADTWHHLSWFFNAAANPWVMKWTVNGASQTDVSFAAAASTTAAVRLGMAPLGSLGSIWFDDWGLSATSGDYPIDPLAVEGHIPTGDGTHSNQSHFVDDGGIVSSGSSTYLKVTPTNQGNWWTQATANGASYLEWTLSDTARSNTILGVAVTCAIRKDSAIGLDQAAVVLRADSADGNVYGPADFPWGSGFWFGKTTLFALSPASNAWTATLVNGAVIRFGYGADVGPKPQIEMVVMEVAFDDEPPEGEESPDPEVTTGPGVWVDWGNDGFACGDIGVSSDPGSLARLVAEGASSALICDEITSDVISIRWRRGSGPDHTGSSNPGEATIVVKNADHKYNPDNTASEFYGLLNPGAPVWIGVNTDGTFGAGGTVVGIFGGFLREIVPTPVDGAMPYAELLCEDALGRYGRSTVSVSPSLSRSIADLRNEVLDAVDEDPDRRALDTESNMLFFSSVDSNNALTTLDELNRVTASRHWIAPGDSFLEWFFYSTANRLYKVTEATDDSLDGENIDAINGYRVTEENIINSQRADVTPLSLSLATDTVWTYGQTPFTVTSAESKIIWANFEDHVFNAAIQANVSSGSITSIVTNFGQSAKLQIDTAGTATVGSLIVTGQRVERGDPEQVVAEDFSSQSRYKVRAGAVITSDWAGQTGQAQGLVDFLVWKFAQPLKRPDMTVVGKNAATLLTVLTRDLYDTVDITVDRLDVVARRFEIVGLSGSYQAGGPWAVTYELQETRNQTALDYFEIDEDSVNGAALIAPF